MRFSKVGLSLSILWVSCQPLLIQNERVIEFEQYFVVEQSGYAISLLIIRIKREDICRRLFSTSPITKQKISHRQIVLRCSPILR